MTFRRALRSWDRFLFAPISPLPAAVYRILFGLIVLTDLVLLLPEVDTFFGDTGIFPLADSLKMMGTRRLDVLVWLPNTPLVLHAFFALSLLAAVCLTVGLFTHVSAVAVFVALVSIHHRDPLILNGADTFMRQAAFSLMFMPTDRAISAARRRLAPEEPALTGLPTSVDSPS